MPATARLGSVVLDCPDPEQLADFYARLTGLKVLDSGPDWATLGGEGQVNLCFQRAEDYRPPVWKSREAPQQFHLDLLVSDLEAAQAEALALGAGVLEAPADRAWRVYADPAGHPFCLCKD